MQPHPNDTNYIFLKVPSDKGLLEIEPSNELSKKWVLKTNI